MRTFRISGGRQPQSVFGGAMWQAILFITLALLLSVCGKDETDPVYVKVNLQRLPSSIDTLSVQILLNDAPHRSSPYPITPPKSEFWIEFDPKTTGRVAISVDAEQAGCAVASGRIDSSLNGESYRAFEMELALLPTPSCTLVVKRKGNGLVTSDPVGMSCGETCSMKVERGKSVRLIAQSDTPSIPFNWSGPCQGNGDCNVTVNEGLTAYIDFTSRVCDTGWCWENPLIQGNSLLETWAAPDGTLYAVGSYGTIVQYKGNVPRIMPTGTIETLNSVFGFSNNDVWAVGNRGIIFHYTGSTWKQESGLPSTASFMDVWGSGPQDIWVAGGNGVILHYNGTAWALVPSATSSWLNAVWGSGPNDVWAVGDGGVAVKWDGTQWKQVSSATTSDLTGLWGSGAGDYWATGRGNILHLTGSIWSAAYTEAARLFNRVWGSGVNDVWVTAPSGALFHWDGIAWKQTSTGLAFVDNLEGITGLSKTTVWAVGAGGVALSFDGSQWKSINPNTDSDPSVELRSGWAIRSNDAWVVGKQNQLGGKAIVLRWDGLAWSQANAGLDLQNQLNTVWASNKDDVWAGGLLGIVRWNGATWTKMSLPMEIRSRVDTLCGTGPNDVWAFAEPYVIHWDGLSWQIARQITPAAAVPRVLACAGTNVWLSGNAGSVWLWNGQAWSTEQTSVSSDIVAMSALGPDEVYAAASPSLFLRRQSGIWSSSAIASLTAVKGILARSSSDILAIGNNGPQATARYDGTAWTKIESGTTISLSTIFGIGSDIWVAGSAGAILHRRN